MNPLERIVRLMTHFNIAATIATAAWVLWSGVQVVSGTGPWPGAVAMHHGEAGALAISAPPSNAVPAAAAPAACHAGGKPHCAAGWSDT